MQNIFSQFNLDEKETGAFLELVKLGASPVSVWAKHAQINRSSMYVLLDRLIKTGLVTVFIHKNVQHVQPISVARISSLLEQKQKEIEGIKTILQAQLPDLLALEKTNAITPTVQFFEGKHRVEAMYEEVIKERSYRAFFHPARVKTSMPAYFHKIPLALRVIGGSAKELVIRCKEADEYIRLYRSPKHQIKLLTPKITFSSDTIITKQKIYLVGYSAHETVGTEIWNEELAKTQAVLFDLIWSKTV